MEERNEDGHDEASLSEKAGNLKRRNTYGVSGRHNSAVTAAPALIARTILGVQDVSIYVEALIFTAALCIATAVVFALIPLATMDRRNQSDALHDDAARATPGPRKLRLQRSFVVSAVALAFVLLVGAGLLMRSFSALVATEIGFRPAQVLAVSMTLPRTFYTTADNVRSFHESLYRNLTALPSVRSVALATDLPLTTYELRAFTPEGTQTPDGAQPTTRLTWAHGPYFETLGMTLKRGRFFNADEYARNRTVVIVNEKLAQRFWPGEDPIGRRLKWGLAGSPAPWLTIVGVISDVIDGPIGAEPGIHAYEPFRQLPDFILNGATNQFGRDVKAAILVDGDPRTIAGQVRREISTLEPELAIEMIQPMTEQVRNVLAPQRLSAMLVGVFAAIALLLASVGLYGLLAFTIAQRKREIAVRLALGAERSSVIRMIVGQGARLVAVGLTVGFAASLGVAKLAESLLYRTSPYDLTTFIVAPVVLAVAALTACALPAWRAAHVEPLRGLRAE